MKKKIVLALAVISMLVCFFAISVSAATTVEFDGNDYTVTTYTDVNAKTNIDVTNTVDVVIFADGFCCPTAYVFKDQNYAGSKNAGDGKYAFDFSYINGKTGVEYTFDDIRKLDIPQGVVKLAQRAFQNVTTLEEVSIPSSVTTIEYSAFQDAKGLKRCTFEHSENDGLTSIPSWIFSGCTSLEALAVPDCVTTIDGQHFLNKCSSLTAVYLSKNLVSFPYTLNDSNKGPFNECVNMYLVNEPFTYDRIPTKPEVYFFPSGLSSENMTGCYFRLCSNINKVLVFGEGVTAMPNDHFFQDAGNQSVVFLGDMTKVCATSSWPWSTKNIYFVNENDKSAADLETLSINAATQRAFFCHAEGDTTHLEDSRKSVKTKEPNCVDNAWKNIYCFCGANMGEVEIENSNNGGTHDLENATVISVVYNDFTSTGTKVLKCPKCDVDDITDKAPALFTCSGYSMLEQSECKSISQGFNVNIEAIELYNSVCEQGKELRFGVFAGVESVLGDNVEIFENGELISNLPVVTYECESTAYRILKIKIVGLEKSNNATIPVYCGAYVLSYEGDEVVSTYLTTGLYGATIESETLTEAHSYNEILEASELMKTKYVGYDGYIWQANKRTDTLSAPLANDVAENTLELFDCVFFTRNDISAGTRVVLMGNYFEYARCTPYSNATVTELATYVSNDGCLDIGKLNLITGEYSLITTADVTSGKNVISLNCKIGNSETLVLGGDNTTVGLYSVSGVDASDEYGIYSTDTQSLEISETNGLKNKLVVNVKIALSASDIECLTPELEDVYADRTSGYAAVDNTVAPFIYVDEDLFEGRTLKSMKLYVNSVSYSDGYATMNIATLTVPNNFYKNKTFPSLNEVYTIKLPSDFFGGATDVNAWYEIDFTKYAYKANGTQATEGIVVSKGETLAFDAKASDTVVWGFNDNVFSEVETCEQFYYKTNNQLAFGSSTSVLNFLFYYERVSSYESVQDHLSYLTELDKKAYVKAELKDKQLSILGDSISTFEGYSNDSANGLGKNAVFYNSSFFSIEDTYWYQLMDMYGMELCVNNSWSGAYASLHTPNVGSNVDRDGSVSSGVIRANYLAKSDGTAPDYIVVYIGINDLNNGNVTDDVVCEAYMEILDIISEKYPQAKVFCVNLPKRTEGNDPNPINTGIKKAVDEHDNAYLVDLYNSHYSGEKYKYNSSNSSKNTDNLHPNALGMDFITEFIYEAMEAAILEQYSK